MNRAAVLIVDTSFCCSALLLMLLLLVSICLLLKYFLVSTKFSVIYKVWFTLIFLLTLYDWDDSFCFNKSTNKSHI